MSVATVSTVLWSERELLELLLFKLEEQQLVLASGRARWLSHSAREVEMVVDQIRAAELSRAVAVDELAHELGLPPAPSLAALARLVPMPHNELLMAHRDAFLLLTDEISTLSKANRELLGTAQRAQREAMLALDDAAGATTYSSHGDARSEPARARVVDRAL